MMMRQLKQILTLLMTIVLTGTLSAQTSVSAKADNDLKEFEAQYHAGANSAQLYETLYSAYKSYRKIADKNPKDRTAQNGLRKVYPHLVNGAVYYSSNKNNARAADFAAAYIDIPLMPAFKMERFSRDNMYPSLCYLATEGAYNNRQFEKALLYSDFYIQSGDKTYLRSITAMYSNITNIGLENKNYSLAEQSINKLLALTPNDQKLLYAKALLDFNREDYNSSVNQFKKLYQQKPNDYSIINGYAKASYNYALVLMDDGKNHLAKHHLETASQLFELLANGGNISASDRQKYKYNHQNAKGLIAEINKGNGGYFASTGTSSRTNNRQSSPVANTTPQRTDTQPSMPNNTYMTREELPTLDEFAEDFITTEFEKWKEKGRYEPTADYAARVTTENAEKKKLELKQIAMDKYIAEYSSKIRLDNLRLEDYDADNQTFLLISPDFGNIVLPVPRNEAEAFEKQWHTVSPEYPQFGIASNDHKLALAQLTFRTNNGNRYITDPNADFIDRSITANIDIDTDDLKLDDIITAGGLAANNNKIKKETTTVGGSDVDVDIPVTKKKNDNLFAIIIANELYENESRVSFAHNDGTMFKTYCIKTLGADDRNVHFVKDATLGNIRKELRWIKNIADAFQGEAQIILYYAGHGVPDEASKSAYLLPTDGTATDIESGYKLDDLYATLGNLPAKSVTVFLDACFSGAQRSGDPMESKKNSRAPIIKAKASVPQGKMTVFSAATGDETAFPYEEQKHGMFTYFLLKKLKESKGDVSYGELSDYISKNVKQNSLLENQKSQTPTTISSTSVTEDEWRKWNFRN